AAHGVAAPGDRRRRVRRCGWRRRRAGGSGDRRGHGGARGSDVCAGVDITERGLVVGDGAAALASRTRGARAPTQESRRRLPRGARALSHARTGRGDRTQARPALLDLPADAVSGRPLPRSRLDALVPSLLTGQALVSLVPATGDHTWAAGAAWDVARAAAQGDRRVALVDLWLERPTLHEVVGLNPAEGIVDAFEYDVSLTKAAHEVDRVFFIAAGTVTAHAGDLFANPRWRKLHGGFRSEDALLLLYLSAGALARLSTVPDGLIVLSADGYEPESSIGQGITAAMERGIPLLGVVRERWTPLATPAPDPRAIAPPPGRISAAVRPGLRTGVSHRRTRPVVIAATLVAGTAGGWVSHARLGGRRAGHVVGSPARPTRTGRRAAGALLVRSERHHPGRAAGARHPRPGAGRRRPPAGGRARDPRAGRRARSAPQACRRSRQARHPDEGHTMRLTRLELAGFKSFAGAVELPFETGVTAIVGPNGCGKSNISDAVRWVLGEQSPRLLRGGKMEDVIFQGSTGRRPVNVAEVSLVFDNTDGTLPIAYQEVLVTRRLSRSGQSEYLLNRSPVRLRDIQDLLRGTGLGADAAVVMEARMIEALLSEKAEERRALFEEAAGIGLYRDRKTSTERRLEETA